MYIHVICKDGYCQDNIGATGTYRNATLTLANNRYRVLHWLNRVLTAMVIYLHLEVKYVNMLTWYYPLIGRARVLQYALLGLSQYVL